MIVKQVILSQLASHVILQNIKASCPAVSLLSEEKLHRSPVSPRVGMEGALDLEVWVEEQGRLLALEREAEIAEVRWRCRREGGPAV